MSACQPVRSLPLKMAVKPSFASAAGTLLSVSDAFDVQVSGGGGGVCGPRPRPSADLRCRGSRSLRRQRAPAQQPGVRRGLALRKRPHDRQRGEDGECGSQQDRVSLHT